ncbi:LLM class flavin-dependent oxidoreductase [Rhodococcus sp. IEGM 1307]|uniref:LLM class flavin-dependent oxidoreductase n=1 Tax=Rhodococcus sp. IEGM 1307 TaxID=3047091 RepID=UPI0024B76741|nr:LLM class flavin-dependent oxidoreductase [Rhodococcus sp. IEGM 1307]MDI9979612.1 LLM class flavin-dependent oxidoreductase [Rhodococcus sp. IEGM 1307]
MTSFGVHTALEGCTVRDLQETWRHAEDLGFDWVSIWDHLHPAVHPVEAGSLDSIACHTALALTTDRVRVGSLVYSVGFRHPGLLARAAATIDHLSGGRVELGLGAGWHREEYDAFGFPFESPAIRLRRLREAVEVVRLLWREEAVEYEGEFYRLRGAHCGIRPVQEKPRIWVGASGEKLGLSIVAAVNDGWNCSSVTPEELRRKHAIVMEAAADPDAIVTAVNVGLDLGGDGTGAVLAGSVEQVTDTVGRYVEAGADRVILRLIAPFQLDELDLFAGSVMPRFTEPSTPPVHHQG